MADGIDAGTGSAVADFSAEIDGMDLGGADDGLDAGASDAGDQSDQPLDVDPVEDLAAEEVLADDEGAADQIDADADPAAEVAPEKKIAATDPLPEGVTEIDRGGKKEYRVRETQFKNLHDSFKLRSELEQRLVPLADPNKPITIEDLQKEIDVRDKAYLGFQEMDADFMSGSIAGQKNVVDHWLNQASKAVQDGEVASDPVVSFAGTFYDRLMEKHPDAFAALQNRATFQLLDDLYDLAITSGDKNVLASAQRVEMTLYNRFRNDKGEVTEVAPKKAPTPAHMARTAPAAQPGAAKPDQAWTNYRTKTDSDSRSAVLKTVETSLADVKAAYDKAGLPETFGGVLDRLNNSVHKELRSDADWQRIIRLELQKAQTTGSEQRRREIADQIIRRHEARARQIVGRLMPPIIAEASKSLKVNFDSKHKRLKAAQELRTPGGNGLAPKKSLLPGNPAEWDVRNPRRSFEAEIDAMA